MLGNSPHGVYASLMQWVENNTAGTFLEKLPSFPSPTGKIRTVRISAFDDAGAKFGVVRRVGDSEWCLGGFRVMALFKQQI